MINLPAKGNICNLRDRNNDGNDGCQNIDWNRWEAVAGHGWRARKGLANFSDLYDGVYQEEGVE